MKMNLLEKVFVRSPVRVYFLRKYEAPRVLSNLPGLGGSTCIEIGCAHGAGLFLIKHFTGCHRMIGIDIDREMIRKAKHFMNHPPRWVQSIPRDGIMFAVSDASELPFPGALFDAAFHFFTFDHMPDWQLAVVEVYRVLKPGGIYTFEEALFSDSPVFMNRYFGHVPISDNEIRQTIRNTGFVIESFEHAVNSKVCFVRAVKKILS
jgi:ubiquinone/menaquinone biosynthesis C-methylase UbiE